MRLGKNIAGGWTRITRTPRTSDKEQGGVPAFPARVDWCATFFIRPAPRMCIRQIGFAVLLIGIGMVVPVSAQPQEMPLGSVLPQEGLAVQLADGSSTTIAGLVGEKGTVFLFWSNQCPWIDKYRDRILALHEAFSGRGIAFVAVNANDASSFPQESLAESVKQRLPLAYVAANAVPFAEAVGASRTPHVFAFNASKTLIYAGTIDDSPGDPANVQKHYLQDVLEQLVAGAEVTVPKTKAFGCTIKYPQ